MKQKNIVNVLQIHPSLLLNQLNAVGWWSVKVSKSLHFFQPEYFLIYQFIEHLHSLINVNRNVYIGIMMNGCKNNKKRVASKTFQEN